MAYKTEERPAGTGPAAAQGASPMAASRRLILPGSREGWTYCVSPSKLQCINGQVLPRLTKAWWTPGLNGNGRARGYGEGFVGSLLQSGHVMVPHDIPCTAFGRDRSDAPLSVYLDRYEGRTARGAGVVYHSDAWHRPRSLGHVTRWDFDEDGWLEFLASCLKLVTREVDPLQAQLATEQTIQRIRTAADREDKRSQRELNTMLRHMSAAHAPPDVLDLMGAAGILETTREGRLATKARGILKGGAADVVLMVQNSDDHVLLEAMLNHARRKTVKAALEHRLTVLHGGS